jgi:hypothetical protein
VPFYDFPSWVEPTAEQLFEVGLRGTLRIAAFSVLASALIGIVLGTLLSIRFVPSDEDLDRAIISLAQHFGERAQDPNWRVDGLFMMASLRAVLGDFSGAHFTITEAIRRGDDDQSAYMLRDTLVDLLHKELYGS